jgi:predicted amidohydrolase
MRRTISVASLQIEAHDRGDFQSVWPRICERISLAAASGAQLIVLPEGTVPGYVIGNVPVDSSVTERALSDVQGIAKRTKTVIVYGSARFDAGLMYNSAIVVDSDGAIAGVADKCFLWHFDRQWFARGEVRAPIRTSAGTLGVMICADGRIPTIARSLVDRGADLLVMPTAWVTSGRDPENLENIQADLLAQVRARENGVAFVAANKCGVERGCVAYCGKSQIIDSAGEVLALAPQRGERAVTAVVTTRKPEALRAARSNPARSTFKGEAKRFAISPYRQAVDPELLGVLEVDHVLNGEGSSDNAVLASTASATVGDATVLDPAGLVPYKISGYELIIWRSDGLGAKWQTRFARARAVELRIYLICIVAGQIAFAVDPDGAVLAGTFGTFRVASFQFVPERTRQTAVAPGTDIMEGLEHAGL